ncbi:hypothetical protein QCA50_006235 [Cerrena zonata]|uniref:Clathrin/coatomer adaptor adaptin-like N-terminal domain-containing protein n=1 Tax=Cerrena zonata TaxID=2478898 RepID=A0AAW0GF20_9APHY
MAGINLEALAENASRLGTRLQETISEHTRDLAITRGSGAGYLDTPEEKVKLIRKQLDSNSDREKLDAMKRLIALISKGRNVSEYFAQVVKNVASHNLEIRKLVYIYLLRYAEQEPDLALLSINTFQKDLSDSNPLIRAMALRVLSGIRVPMIGSIIVLAIKKCATDISPYVKKAAAQAIPKCCSLDPSHQPEMITVISNLLRDRSPLPIGSVAVAFETVCPTRLDLLHQHYRRLCRTLIDMDEWGQVDLLNLLVRYARTMLPRPSVTEDADGQHEEIDPDLKLLLTSSEPLFQSRNPAVVLAVTRAFQYLGLPSETKKVVSPLLRLLHISSEIERVTLAYILLVARSSPTLFSPHWNSFIVRTDDTQRVKKDKMQLLRLILSPDNYQALLREFTYYADDADDELVADAVQAIGYCARLIPESAQQCLTSLMSFIQSKHDAVVANAVIVLKSLVQTSLHHHQTLAFASTSSAYSPLAIISKLAYRIEDIRHPKARACVLWLVGQYAAVDTSLESHRGPEGVAEWAPDVLRKAATFFTKETSYVKLQIISLAAKLLVLCPSDRTLGLLNRYVLSLARYDLNFDVRDRARMLGSLLSGVTSALGEDEHQDLEGVVLRREQVKMVLFEGKQDVSLDVTATDNGRLLLGSLSAVIGREVALDSYLPEWLEEGVESSLRDSEDDAPQLPIAAQSISSTSSPRAIAPSSRNTPVILTPTGPSPSGSYVRQNGKNNWTDLDKFYADAERTEEDEEEESEEEEEEEEGEGSDDGEEEEEESDRDEAASGEEPETDSADEDADENAHILHHAR